MLLMANQTSREIYLFIYFCFMNLMRINNNLRQMTERNEDETEEKKQTNKRIRDTNTMYWITNQP